MRLATSGLKTRRYEMPSPTCSMASGTSATASDSSSSIAPTCPAIVMARCVSPTGCLRPTASGRGYRSSAARLRRAAASARQARLRHLLFIDLETTGIAGGAGTYAFLVGCAWFDGGRFRIRQFFLSSFTAERALLEAVGDVADTAGTVVSYNGKSFDLPLIETRFALHRLETPFAGMPHIDMLHPARRMWRGVDAACRLSTLEESLCGYVREGDVAGFEIPARYFHYVHAGDARPLAAVFEHNRLDLLSLALVTARAAQLLDEGAPGARTAREALGMGRLVRARRDAVGGEVLLCAGRRSSRTMTRNCERRSASRLRDRVPPSATVPTMRRRRGGECWAFRCVRDLSFAKHQRRWPYTSNIGAGT